MTKTDNQSQSQSQSQSQQKGKTPLETETAISDSDAFEEFSPLGGGLFRGIAAAARVKAPIAKAAIRSIGANRPLAFASEGAVAGAALMPRWMYYGAWGLSGLAIGADITSKTWDAKAKQQEWETAAYWTAFHIPASLVVPAVIIHRIVHATEHSMEHHSYAKKIPPRFKPFLPVGAALLSIIPVVPTVDYAAEAIMEPTLGSYLGLEFDHHHGHSNTTSTNTNTTTTTDDSIESAKGKEKKD